MKKIITGAVLVFALAGCGADKDSSPAYVTNPPKDVPSATPSKTIPSPKMLKLGDKTKVTVGDVVAEVSALKYRHVAEAEGVKVRVCFLKGEGSVSRIPWSLAYEDFEQLHNVDVAGGGLPAPAYEDRDMRQGECASGWVNFTEIPDEKPTGIQYEVEGLQAIRWEF